MCSAGNRSRTSDLLITNELLYQLSYAGIMLDYYNGIGLIYQSEPGPLYAIQILKQVLSLAPVI